MNEVPVFVQHDVAVVPILNLEQEQEETVGSHAADEVVASLDKEDIRGNNQGREKSRKS